MQSALSSSELGCSEAPGLAAGLRAVDVSPDGRHVYVATTLAVVVLTRDEDSGALTQIVGTSGCVADSRVRAAAGEEAQPEAAELSDCAPADGIPAPSSLTVSPDGRHVYVASGPGDFDGSGSLGVFSRDPRTGALRQVGTTRTRDGGELLDATLSPDGRTLYAATFGNLAVFARDRAGGALRQLPGRAGCIDASSPCTSVPFSMAEVHVAVSPDGHSVYAANGALLSAFSSREDGSLRPLRGRARCHSLDASVEPDVPGEPIRCTRSETLVWPARAVASPDGKHVYVVGKLLGGGGILSQVSVFSRSPR